MTEQISPEILFYTALLVFLLVIALWQLYKFVKEARKAHRAEKRNVDKLKGKK